MGCLSGKIQPHRRRALEVVRLGRGLNLQSLSAAGDDMQGGLAEGEDRVGREACDSATPVDRFGTVLGNAGILALWLCERRILLECSVMILHCFRRSIN